MKCPACKTKFDKKYKCCPTCGRVVSVNKKLVVLISTALVLSLLVGVVSCALVKGYEKKLEEYYDGFLTFDEGFSDVIVENEDTAIQSVKRIVKNIGVSDAEKELSVKSKSTVNGNTYYRMEQLYNGIPVYGSMVTLCVNARGTSLALTANTSKIELKQTEPGIYGDEILDLLKTNLKTDNISMVEVSEKNLIVYRNKKNGEDLLAYSVQVSIDYDINTVVIDANNGSILEIVPFLYQDSAEVYSNGYEIKAEGWQNQDGKYQLYNDEFKISVFDLKNANTGGHTDSLKPDFTQYGVSVIESDSNQFDNKGVIVLDNAVNISRYYKNIGFDGFTYVHIGINESMRDNGENAYGGGNQTGSQRVGVVTIGEKEDVSSVDLLGHEYNHAVTGTVVSWTNFNESQAINEGYADVFGELAEEYSTGKPMDWVHGERIIKDPSSNNYPTSINDECKKNKEDYSHKYSTVVSNAAYRMWDVNGENGKLDSSELTRLWYSTLFLLPSDVSFSQFSESLLLTARVMLRNKQIDYEKYNNIIDALDDNDLIDSQNLLKIRSGGKLYVEDIDLNLYDNYHLSIKSYKSYFDYRKSKDNGETVYEGDITSKSGYKVDLKEGLYLFSVSDNAINGSTNTIEVLLEVVETRVGWLFTNDEYTITTDFGEKPLTAEDYLNMTVADVKNIHGDDISVSGVMSGYIPDSTGHDAIVYYSDDRIPFDFLMKDVAENGSVNLGDDDMVSEVNIFDSEASIPVEIADGIMSDTTYGQLKTKGRNRLFPGTPEGTYYCVIKSNSDVYCCYTFDEYPMDDSVADSITVTRNGLSYEEWFDRLGDEDIITLTGVVEKVELDVVAVSGKHYAYVLNVDNPENKEVMFMSNDDLSFENLTVDSVQVSTDKSEFEKYLGCRVEITGTVHTVSNPREFVCRKICVRCSDVKIIE